MCVTACPRFALFRPSFKPLPVEGRSGCLQVCIIIKISAVTALAHESGVFGWFFCEADGNAVAEAKTSMPLKTLPLPGPPEARSRGRPPHSRAPGRLGPRALPGRRPVVRSLSPVANTPRPLTGRRLCAWHRRSGRLGTQTALHTPSVAGAEVPAFLSPDFCPAVTADASVLFPSTAGAFSRNKSILRCIFVTKVSVQT